MLVHNDSLENREKVKYDLYKILRMSILLNRSEVDKLTLDKFREASLNIDKMLGEEYDENGRLAGFTAILPNNTEWSGNSPYFTAEYLNALYAEGVRKLSFNVTSSDASCNFITYYNNGLDYDPRDGYEPPSLKKFANWLWIFINETILKDYFYLLPWLRTQIILWKGSFRSFIFYAQSIDLTDIFT